MNEKVKELVELASDMKSLSDLLRVSELAKQIKNDGELERPLRGYIRVWDDDGVRIKLETIGEDWVGDEWVSHSLMAVKLTGKTVRPMISHNVLYVSRSIGEVFELRGADLEKVTRSLQAAGFIVGGRE